MTTSSSVGVGVARPSRQPPLVLGVDGGGTKTLAWLAQVDERGRPQVIGRGLASSSNKVAVGLETALSNLASAIDQACAESQLAKTPIASAVFALAGSGTAEVRQNVLDFAKNHLQIKSAQVVHDGQAVLQAGTPDGWGIALIAGTGAVAYGVNQASQIAVVGGWGYWFGDEGSAFWLGQSALRAIAQAADGRGNATALTAAVLGRLEIEQPRTIISALSDGGDVRQAIADLADLVCKTAEQHDEVASRIVAEATRHWMHHIKSVAHQLDLGEEFPLAVAGGVLCGSRSVRDRLLEQLQVDQLTPSSVQFVPEPIVGCLQLACRPFNSTRDNSTPDG